MTQYTETDVMPLNNFDCMFRQMNGLKHRPHHARSNNSQAINYDGDGMRDVIMVNSYSN